VTACLIKGFALGGGLELALVCDFIGADHEARLGFPEIRLACFPPVAAVLLPRWIGKQSNLLLTGDTISAQRAAEIGIVDDVISPEHSAEWLQHFKDKIGSYSLDALRILKKALRKNAGFDFDKALQDCEKIYVKELLASPDAVEGVLAFLEKRSPVYGAKSKPKRRYR
ncbi:MAG TPA: enoyl-CoA hydratase-related protein, partial [Acidobacteriota bacterium]|nr:enoyl-CoA hydratase-related protein [Acidobacteriota bacterium]